MSYTAHTSRAYHVHVGSCLPAPAGRRRRTRGVGAVHPSSCSEWGHGWRRRCKRVCCCERRGARAGGGGDERGVRVCRADAHDAHSDDACADGDSCVDGGVAIFPRHYVDDVRSTSACSSSVVPAAIASRVRQDGLAERRDAQRVAGLGRAGDRHPLVPAKPRRHLRSLVGLPKLNPVGP